MKTKPIQWLVVAVSCINLLLAPEIAAATRPVRSLDVALQAGGTLVGQVVNTEGQPIANSEVIVAAQGKPIARAASDAQGNFRIASLKGGTVEVAAVGVAGNCRLWAPGTAPPAAQNGLLVVAEGEVVRGQHMGRHVPGRSYRGGVRGHGGGLLALMIEHPLVTAGAIGTAIAVPLAVSNDKSPSSP